MHIVWSIESKILILANNKILHLMKNILTKVVSSLNFYLMHNQYSAAACSVVQILINNFLSNSSIFNSKFYAVWYTYLYLEIFEYNLSIRFKVTP